MNETDDTNCQWCRERVSLEIMSTVYYGGKVYHGVCFDALERMAKAVKGEL